MSIGSTVDHCRLINLPKIKNRAGNITPITNNIEIPFAAKRVYYLYDIPGGEERGGHAHKELMQLIVAAGGSFNICINDGEKESVINLNQPYYGLLIVPGIWREIKDFSSGAICLVLASDYYFEADYIRDINQFREYKKIES